MSLDNENMPALERIPVQADTKQRVQDLKHKLSLERSREYTYDMVIKELITAHRKLSDTLVIR